MSESSEPKRRIGPRRRGRFVVMVLLIALGVQLPLVAALAHLSGHRGAVLALAAAITGGFMATLFGGRSTWGSPGPLRLYLVLWPFFVWWTLGLTFAAVAPLAVLVALGAHASWNAAWAIGIAAALLATLVAFLNRPRVREHAVAIGGLPAAFDGYRVAQISDLHCGPFASGARVDGWVESVNRLQADLVAVTGDLIANGSRFVPVVAASLGRLRGRDGVFACMGNHDYFADGEEMALALERAGLTLLRNRGVEVRRDGGALYVAGVDDTWTGRHDLPAALAARPDGAPVLLLAHDPALFPDAAKRGVALTLSGHTHGGQLGVPFFAKRFNLARSITRFTTGLYRIGAATLYVTRGLGTTGMPIRLFVPPEITVITLRRAPGASAAAEPVAPAELQPA
ncbi:MAG TPA: metallophosphoesterase [Polyangia bacterium]|nr:metallophosphoesterase [Polyangia bacterium]